MKTIVYFTRYSRMGPSSRIRSYQFKERLEGAGYRVLIKNLFNDRYIQGLYAEVPRKSLLNAMGCYLRRVLDIFLYTRKGRVVIIEKELLPYFPPLFERFLSLVGVKYWVDIDDAIFHYYDETKNPIIKLMANKKIDKVFKYADKVLVGNEYLAKRARQSCRNVHIFPTVIDTKLFMTKLSKLPSVENEEVIIGWIGSPSTVKYFEPIIPVLDKMSYSCPFKLRVVGSNKKFESQNLVIEYFDWSEEQEIELINSFGIGIMPLQKSLFEKGKCGYKLIQYFGCKKPVVASPVGVNSQIVVHGQNGFLAANDQDWEIYLKKLLKDSELRKELGGNGFSKASTQFNLSVNATRLIQWIESND